MTAQLAIADQVEAPDPYTLWLTRFNTTDCPAGSNARVEHVGETHVSVRVTCAGFVNYDYCPVAKFREAYLKPGWPWSKCQYNECCYRLGRYLRTPPSADQRRTVARLTKLEAYLRRRLQR